MTKEIPMPEISPNFTIEDIRKIREWHYEKRKGMTPEEIIEDTNKGAVLFEALLKKPPDTVIQAEIKELLRQNSIPIAVVRLTSNLETRKAGWYNIVRLSEALYCR